MIRNITTRCIAILAIILCFNGYSQAQNSPIYEGYKPHHKFSVSAGLTNGINSMLSANINYMPGNVIGWQLGAGMEGVGAALNFHLRQEVNSPAITVNYWYNGLGNNYEQSVFGMTYMHRTQRYLSTQLGLGYITTSDGNFNNNARDSGIVILYSLGVYFSR